MLVLALLALAASPAAGLSDERESLAGLPVALAPCSLAQRLCKGSGSWPCRHQTQKLGYSRERDSLGGWWALAGAPAAADQPDASPSIPMPRAELLLALPRNCAANWANATAKLQGAEWVAGTPACGDADHARWKGVQACNAAGSVTNL